MSDPKYTEDRQQQELARVRQEQQDKANMDAAMAAVQRWDKNMTRAFKGIVTAPERRAMLNRTRFDG